MDAAFDLIPVSVGQTLGSQRLERLPEPSQITVNDENVVQYDQVMTTKLVLAYAAGLAIVHRSRGDASQRTAVDLACGPGHYTLCLARYLGYQRIAGVDLSPRMVEVARKNAASEGLADRVAFRIGDVCRLDAFDAGSVDLTSFTDAAHHMPDIATVGKVLCEMDRITRPDGLVMLMDLARLRTARLTERYVNTLAWDYRARGLPQFFEDFRNSMYAAWTPEEIREAIPRQSDRHWWHVVARALPTVQVIVGLPVGRRELFVRRGVPWASAEDPVPKSMRWEARLLQLTLWMGSRFLIPPKS